MKTFLKLIPLALTLCFAASFAVEFAGWTLPAALEPLPAFAAFVMSLVILTAFTDYTRPRPALGSGRPWFDLEPKTAHALAA